MLAGAEDHVLVKGFPGSSRNEQRDALRGSQEEALSGLEGVGVGSRGEAPRAVVEIGAKKQRWGPG